MKILAGVSAVVETDTRDGIAVMDHSPHTVGISVGMFVLRQHVTERCPCGLVGSTGVPVGVGINGNLRRLRTVLVPLVAPTDPHVPVAKLLRDCIRLERKRIGAGIHPAP